MRELGEFLNLRRIKAGIPSKESLVQRAGMSRQPIYDLLQAKTAEDIAGTRLDTLEAVAEALLFKEWKELIAAWKTDSWEVDPALLAQARAAEASRARFDLAGAASKLAHEKPWLDFLRGAGLDTEAAKQIYASIRKPAAAAIDQIIKREDERIKAEKAEAEKSAAPAKQPKRTA